MHDVESSLSYSKYMIMETALIQFGVYLDVTQQISSQWMLHNCTNLYLVQFVAYMSSFQGQAVPFLVRMTSSWTGTYNSTSSHS